MSGSRKNYDFSNAVRGLPKHTLKRIKNTIPKSPSRKRRVTGPDDDGSVYVYFQEVHDTKAVVRQSVEHKGIVVLDYDKDGKLFGIEILDVLASKATRK